MAINRSGKNKSYENKVTGEAKYVEKDAIDSPVKDVHYDVTQGEVHSDVRLQDDLGWGKEVILRRFEFKYPPGPHKVPTKEEVLEKHWLDHVKTQLYFLDELEMVQEPRVVFSEKGFDVFFTCQARKGSLVHDRPLSLKDIADGHTRQNPE